MSNWISHKAQYFKKNGDIDRKKECTCFLLDTINSDLYEVVHAAFYCNVYYAAVVQTKIFNDQEYKEIPKEEQEITAMVIDTKTEKKEFIYLNLSYLASACTDNVSERFSFNIFDSIQAVKSKIRNS